MQAVKTDEPPTIDAVLDDVAWKDVPVASNFIQNFPSYGNVASQITEVKVVYDNSAIYIGAYLHDDPSLIRKQITARDEEQQKDLDFFSVFLDTYHDQQNGFQFLVTSSNVQTDARLAPDQTLGIGEYGDKTWDAVWDSKVSMVADGWIVEMKIPYLSLRFARKNIQDWGIQFLRFVRRNNETSFWNPVDPKVNGFVNQFGVLQNLADIQPPLRLSFSPYVSTGIRSIPEKGSFRTEGLGSGGMDVKYGINESFTLDATLIPDFGQVVSDNVVNNLTPYEVSFIEYRPFFTEGTEIFNKSGLFYSRRIGATPSGYQAVRTMVDNNPDYEIIRNPARTQLYNALKFSGRTQKKLGIGVFNAISAPMYASIRDKITGDKIRIQTEPFANYNILVLDQALKGRSYVTVTNTNVLREGSSRDANVSGLDLSLYDKNNTYNLKLSGRYSTVFSLNPHEGYSTSLRVEKVSGRIQYAFQNVIRSYNYDPNDLGFLPVNNQIINTASVSYNQFTPTRSFLSYNYELAVQQRRLYSPNRFGEIALQATGAWILKNFWDVTLTAAYLTDQHDYFIIGKPYDKYAHRPQYGYINLSGSTDSRKRLYFNYNVLVADFFKNPEKKYHIFEGGLRYRFSNKLTMDMSHRFETETDYITVIPRDTIPGDIAFVDFKDVTTILSGIYNFTPRINLTLRLRHYWSHVPAKRANYVDNEGRPISPAFIPVGVTDNVNFFNIDAFFTWDFRYGSRLIVGYKNWLGEEEVIDGIQYQKYFSNVGQSFGNRHANELTVRFIYFLDYNQLRRKSKK